MTTMITLHDDTTIPVLGFGTYLVPPEQTATIVGEALEVGFRHIDTAQMYGNEAGVGEAIKASGIAREDLYLTSKLNNSNHARDDVFRSYDESVAALGVDKLDLFLMHWPLPTRYGGDFVTTWKAMTELVEQGRLTSAGVSNFEPMHLDRIIEETGVIPVVNQIEAHPYFHNDIARRASKTHGIAVEAWSPLGRGSDVLKDPAIQQVAEQVDRTPAQVILRWHLQRGDIIFPKSMHRERMAENFAIFNFELDAEQQDAVSALDRGEQGRVGPNPNTFDLV